MSGLTDEQRDKVLAEMVLGLAHAICATTHGGKGYCVNCRSIAERVYAPMIADGHLLPVVADLIRDAKAEAWDEGHLYTGYQPEHGENPYRDGTSWTRRGSTSWTT